MIADCKSFKKTKASRPHVRSVIGSMMTYRKIVKAQRGTGILLTTTEFTKPAMQCADEFNSLHADAYRNGFRAELWNLNVLRDKLKQKFPDDNAKEEAKMVKELLGFIIENLQK